MSVGERVEALAVVGEHAERPERRFGNMELLDLELDSLILLPQVREGTNPMLDELQASIDADDLDNPINVARLNDEELTTYLSFVNKTWGSRLHIGMYEDLRQEDGQGGYFNLVVAGHTRTIAIGRIAQEEFAESGVWPRYTVSSKILRDTSVAGIVAKQVAENLHSRPKEERSLTALVEMGLADPSGLDKLGGRISKSMRARVEAVSVLPAEVRGMIFRGRLSVQAGVSLGLARSVIREHLYHQVGLCTEEMNDDLEQAVDTRLRREGAHIAHRPGMRRNGPAAAKYIAAIVKPMQASLAGAEDMTEQDVPLFEEFRMVTAAEQAREFRRKEEVAFQRLLRELSSGPAELVAELITYLTVDRVDNFVETLAADTRAALVVLGHVGQAAAASVVELSAARTRSKARIEDPLDKTA